MSAQPVPNENGISLADALEDSDTRPRRQQQETASPLRENHDGLEMPAVQRVGPRERVLSVSRTGRQRAAGRGPLPVANPIDTSAVPVADPVPTTDGFDLDAVRSTDSDRQRKRRRLQALVAVIITAPLLLLAVGLAVGLTVTEPPDSLPLRPSPAPAGDIPTASPTGTASPTLDFDAYCRLKYEDFNECVGYIGNGTSACERCIVDYFSGVLNVDLSNFLSIICTDVDDETCDALATCSDSCFNCTQEVVTYVECQSLCPFGGYSCSGESTR